MTATSLRASLAQVHALAAQTVADACASGGVDANGALSGAAWVAGPVALLANLRRQVEAAEAQGANARPPLSAKDLRGRLGDRVAISLPARSLAERTSQRGAEATGVFAMGAEPAAILAEASAGTAGSSPDALHHAFLDRLIATLLASTPALGPALAPFAEAGLVRIGPRDAEPRRRGVVIVVPALYAKDEIALIARRLATEAGAGAAFGMPTPSTVLVGTCWDQRTMFMEVLREALAVRSGRTPVEVVQDAEPGPFQIAVTGAGCDEPVSFLARTTETTNALGPSSVEIVVHTVHEEEPTIADALDRAIASLATPLLAVNEWPALLSFRGDAPGAPGMPPRLDKTVLRCALFPARTPVHLDGGLRGAARGARLAAFHAAPTFGAALRA